MIRNLLATTALATLISTGAFAQEATAPAATTEPAPMTQDANPAIDANAQVERADGHLASNIIGEEVYNGTGDDAENIGEVNDIVISADGSIESVVIGVGGFLGIGEKDVAVEYSQLDWAERDGDRWLVAPMSKEQLESQTAFDASAYEPAPANVAVNTTAQDGMAPATDQTAAAPAADPAVPATDQTAQAPASDPAVPATDQSAQAPATDNTATAAIDRSTLKEIPSGEIRAEEMVGTTVYGANDANVGEIGDVILTADGQVDAYIIDVGGFLGIGEKEVAVGSDNLAFMTDKDGNKYLYTTFTEEQLEAAPAYDEGTYADTRDDQRMIMTK
ncbi:MAG: PRC-barrel domain-containing protein [Alphaproteobacteria bacterium]|nr:PRC-barrel domain-containing protein [Alphaproteobacteria bacterium]MBU0805087.1 PRC-barrel domain-containing protein [Alphaproteobacteria bacterium]MBU0870586.1 PRC-barrel domain-containing protein [Alphaproteobacteria bacterium]MBU1401739.1 PRC-barrel domain-containing protein [Alphaproteobacteria bacterium]MBU1591844.1 PRC-barrel domain-containing protein [Alphaproteobacteria bacterium]